MHGCVSYTASPQNAVYETQPCNVLSLDLELLGPEFTMRHGAKLTKPQAELCSEIWTFAQTA